MPISSINVTGVRNLAPVSLTLSPRINILFGDNGSGKTSFLEAIHFLALARSFRSTRIDPMIQKDADQALVFAEFTSANDAVLHKLGVSRDRQAEVRIRLDGEQVRSISELARHIPLQLINPESFSLLEGSPKNRRQFLDWGVFHVEQSFIGAWQRLQSSLKQRNSLLRHGIMDSNYLLAWDNEFVSASNAIDLYRQNYIRQLKPVFTETLAQLIQLPELTLSYYRGWDKARSLQEVLEQNKQRELSLGYTQAGPQRADLRVKMANQNATDVLSRGQQKLVICALKIAQGYLFAQSLREQCIFLVDDLGSELDKHHRKALCQLLDGLNCQIFITSIDQESLANDWRKDTPVSLFHVEQGRIKAFGVTA